MHNAPEGTFEDPHKDVVLTLGGEVMTEAQRHLIPYTLTDQGRAEENQRIEANGGRAHAEVMRENIYVAGGFNEKGEYVDGTSMEVTSDAEGKQLRKFADTLKEGIQPWQVEGADAFYEVKRVHSRPGIRVKVLSPRKIATHTMRGFKPILQPNGDPYMVGNMIVGEMPEAEAQARTRFYDQQAHQQMVASLDKVREQQEQIASVNKMNRAARRNREELDNGITRFRGNAAEMEDTDFVPSIAEAPVTI